MRLSSTVQNVVEEVMKATDGGAHAAIVVATGNNASDQGACSRICPLALPADFG